MASPRIEVVEDAHALALVGADLVATDLSLRPVSTIVAATGKTPLGLYAELGRRREEGSLSTPALTVFQLDEYLGLRSEDRRSLYGWMRTSFLEPLGIDPANVVRLPVDGGVDRGCEAFDEEIVARGGLDLAILGLGLNGHLGFNEPPSDAASPTRTIDLTGPTLAANARYWGGVSEVPTRAVTMGLMQILSARTIVLVVSGEDKFGIVHRALEGPVEPQVPASYLQRAEGDVVVVADRAAWGGG